MVRFNDRSVTETTGTNDNPFNFSGRKLGPYFLQIGFKSAFCFVIGMANIITNLGFFTAYFTILSHMFLLICNIK